MGGELPKQFLSVAGKPVLMHTLERFHSYDSEMRIVVVLPLEQQRFWKELCVKHAFSVPHLLAPGGGTRFHSVRNGLEKTVAQGVIGVHDGVRPFVSHEVIARCFQEAEQKGAVIPAIPLTDSLRKLQPLGGSDAVNRAEYCLVQTPQVFRATVLHAAYAQPFIESFTDDASVVERCGYPVALTAGNPENIKITHPLDLQLAELLCAHV